ncbi:MAG TPA: BTAD domain-containing putative transcriptional regulator [Gemmatimonadales bacterium]
MSEADDPRLRLRTFGAPAVEGPDGPLGGTAAQPQSMALLALLAAAGERGMSRDKIIALLWPECDAKRARHRLSQLCHALRRSLGEGLFSAAGTELRLSQSRITSDVGEFKNACRRADSEGAVECYGGPFLDGFFLSDAPEFERWVEDERAAFTRELTEALETLAIEAESRGERAEAAQWWSRLAEHEPLSSRVIIKLMSALAAHGDRAGALEQARRYEEELGRELEAEPNPAVVALAARLRAAPGDVGSVPAASRRRVVIALQPFTKLGSLPDHYLAEGLVEEITNALARLEEVRVTSVTSSERLNRAGPNAILEGTIRQIGNRVRVIVRLIDSADGSYLWSNRYDRVVDDVFAVQDDLSKSIVEELRAVLSG